MPNKRRIMQEFWLGEISAVDDPAQVPARFAILKRDYKSSVSAAALKTEPRNPDASGASADDVGKQATTEVITMPEDTAGDLSAKLAKSNEDLKYWKGVAGLSADVRKYFDALPEGNKADFIAKSASERDAEIASFEKANAVVYTATDGTEYRKNDDARLVKMAKDRDEDRKALAEAQEAAQSAVFEKAATDLVGAIPGEAVHKTALAKSVFGLEPEVREGVEGILKAANKVYQGSLSTLGTVDVVAKANTGNLSAAQLIEKAVKKCAEEDKLDLLKARQKVMATPEGQALYDIARHERIQGAA